MLNRSRTAVSAIPWLVVCLCAAQPQSSIDEKARQSLRAMFGDSITIRTAAAVLTEKEKQTIAERSRSRWPGDTVLAYVCRAGRSVAGIGFADNVKGKTQMITYLVGLRPHGEIVDTDVLFYREAYGGEIAYESFRKQFRGRTSLDRLQQGGDIKNISGATISVHAMTTGIKRILVTYEIIQSRLAARDE